MSDTKDPQNGLRTEVLTSEKTEALISLLRADPGSLVPPAALADALAEITDAIGVAVHVGFHVVLDASNCGNPGCPYGTEDDK